MTWQLQQDYKGKFELIKRVLDAESCKNVLDIGCNAGAITNLFGEAGYFAVGLDRNVDCNGKHLKACIGEFKLDLIGIENLPHFDAILLLSALHQIVKENGDGYAKDFVRGLLNHCEILIIELAGLRDKYGYTISSFENNDRQSIEIFFKSWLQDIEAECTFIAATQHNSIREPKRYLFKITDQLWS